jgi:hypothetical protein
MNTFKTILTKLKDAISITAKSSMKIRDKEIATALNIKPATFAAYKSRNKPPYKAILTYCHSNRLDVRKILFNEDAQVIMYPIPADRSDGKVQVRY